MVNAAAAAGRSTPRRCISWGFSTTWVFPKIGVPQNGWFIRENPIEMDYLGVPLFSETSTFTQKWGPLPPRLRKASGRFGITVRKSVHHSGTGGFFFTKSLFQKARCGGRARTATRCFRLKVYRWGQRRLSFMKFADNFRIISDLPWNQLVWGKDPMQNSQACDAVMPSSCTILP